jgi:hypothetical protein
LRVGGEDLGHGLFKLPASVDPTLNFLNPFLGDTLDALLAPGHEGERPNRVSLLIRGTVAGRLTTTAVSEGKRTGQQVRGDGEAAEEFELALAESGGGRAFGCDLHMSVMIHTANVESSPFPQMRK